MLLNVGGRFELHTSQVSHRLVPILLTFVAGRVVIFPTRRSPVGLRTKFACKGNPKVCTMDVGSYKSFLCPFIITTFPKLASVDEG